jgi:hypothetical protein
LGVLLGTGLRIASARQNRAEGFAVDGRRICEQLDGLYRDGAGFETLVEGAADGMVGV